MNNEPNKTNNDVNNYDRQLENLQSQWKQFSKSEINDAIKKPDLMKKPSMIICKRKQKQPNEIQLMYWRLSAAVHKSLIERAIHCKCKPFIETNKYKYARDKSSLQNPAQELKRVA